MLGLPFTDEGEKLEEPPPTWDWNLSNSLHRQARRDASQIWIEEIETGAHATFGQMDERSTKIASALNRRGIGPGRRVLINVANSIDFVAVLFGVVRSGAVAVPINTELSGAMLTHVCRDIDCDFLFADDRGVEKFAKIAADVPEIRSLVLVGSSDLGKIGALSISALSEFEASEPQTDFQEPVTNESSPAVIIYTSGTTGPAKGVILPQAHLFQNAWLYISQIRVTVDDVVYCALPLFHNNGMTLQLYVSLIVGCRLVIRKRFSASAWIDDIRKSKATVTNLLGSMTEFIFAQPQRSHDADNHLRHIVAVPTPESIRKQFEQRFALRLVELYGMTEITCPLYMPIDGTGRRGSCGRLLRDWFEVRIVDPQSDVEVPAGAVGELIVRPLRPHGFMQSYFRRSEETVQAWRNLWFHTGDAMRCDDEGFYYFVDRLKDCVRRRGENISSVEVEQLISKYDAVEEVAVVGVSSPTSENEQEIKACVVLRRNVTPQEIFDFCAINLPQFAIPRVIEVVQTLPKTSTGKVEKAVLRAAGITKESWVSSDINKPRKSACPT